MWGWRAGRGAYPAVLAASEPVRLDAIEFRALTLPALITAKKATGRAKDREHLIELEALLRFGAGVDERRAAGLAAVARAACELDRR